MQNVWSYIRSSDGFINKIKRTGKIPEGFFLVTADQHNDDISALKQKLEEQPSTNIPTNDLVKLAEFILKNNLFEFNNKVKHRISGTAITSKFAPPYACIFMDKPETDFCHPRSPTIYLAALYFRFFYLTPEEAKRKGFI